MKPNNPCLSLFSQFSLLKVLCVLIKNTWLPPYDHPLLAWLKSKDHMNIENCVLQTLVYSASEGWVFSEYTQVFSEYARSVLWTFSQCIIALMMKYGVYFSLGLPQGECQDCPLGGQSWGGQSWVHQSSGLPTPTINFFTNCLCLIWALGECWGHR